MKKSLIDLSSKEDAKELCQGLILDKRVSYEMMSNTNICDAAEVLLAIGDAKNLTSQADLLTRALNNGWTPVD